MLPEPTKNNSLKKLYIKTYGCQMNAYDSDRMQDLMQAIGYKNTDDISEYLSLLYLL